MPLNLVRLMARDLRPFFGRTFLMPASGSQTTDIARTIVFLDRRLTNAEGTARVGSLTVTPVNGATAVTPATSNYWTVRLERFANGDAALATPVTVCVFSTRARTDDPVGSNGLAAVTRYVVPQAAFTATALNLGVADILTISVTHTGTPNAVFPSAYFDLDVERSG